MNLSSILNAAENVASYIIIKSNRRQVILAQNSERLTLPVTPSKYQVATSQDNKFIDILDTGENLIFGNPKLARLKFGSFFPALNHNYPFVVGDTKSPADCIALIDKWQKNKLPVKVTITNSPVNLQMAIHSFNYYEKDGSNDIYFELDFAEYRDWNLRSSNTSQNISNLSGLRTREGGSLSGNDFCNTIKQAQDIFDIAGIFNGNLNNLTDFSTQIKITTPGIVNLPKAATAAVSKFTGSSSIGKKIGSWF